MLIGIPKEIFPGENRVAQIPAGIQALLSAGFEVVVQEGAGSNAHYHDDEYRNCGASIAPDAAALYAQADIILKVRQPLADEAELLREDQTLICLLDAWFNQPLIKTLAERKVRSFALEFIPRTTRAQSMDVLSSQANIAGYKAVMLAADKYQRFFPMLMTAAGTVKAARVVILGVGVAGLQAIATAKRLGAVIEASDVRPSVKEQVESLGAKFIDVPYETAEEKEAKEIQRQRENVALILVEINNKINEEKIGLTAIKERISVEFEVNVDDLWICFASEEIHGSTPIEGGERMICSFGDLIEVK